MVMNEYIREQKFPSILKRGLIAPLYAKVDPLNRSNHRPIPIKSSLSKLFEKLLHKPINQNLSSDELLNSLQFDFRVKISTQNALISSIESIRKHVDNNNLVYSVFSNLSQTIVSVCHKIIMDKLKIFGFKDV